MQVVVLGTGSKGNATYIKTKSANILIDCGFSFRQVKQRLMNYDIDPNSIDAVLITHEHTDHVNGLSSLLARVEADIYISAKTFEKLHVNQKSGIKDNNVVFIDEDFYINDLEIQVVRTSHDANDPMGFVIKDEGKKIVHITDTGYLPEKILEPLKDADMYIFESNYDPEMLFNSRRPFFLKQRIMGNQGHLSNEAAAILLNDLITDRTKHVCFIHLSEETNTPGEARRTHIELLESFDKLTITYSLQHKATEILEV